MGTFKRSRLGLFYVIELYFSHIEHVVILQTVVAGIDFY
jgi:hypothetical protein